MNFYKIKFLFLFIITCQFSFAQGGGKINWSDDGNSYTVIRDGNIIQVDPVTQVETVIIKKELLVEPDTKKNITLQSYSFNSNYTRLLIFTNTAKVWRYNTRGDYWILDIISGKLRKTGKGLPAQSLMFAKFSPDGKKLAYVSEHNIYTEEISTGVITKLTTDGTRKLIHRLRGFRIAVRDPGTRCRPLRARHRPELRRRRQDGAQRRPDFPRRRRPVPAPGHCRAGRQGGVH